jgi:hypothetical protein
MQTPTADRLRWLPLTTSAASNVSSTTGAEATGYLRGVAGESPDCLHQASRLSLIAVAEQVSALDRSQRPARSQVKVRDVALVQA